MARQLSAAAQVAKLCKQYLKSRGIPCRVTSRNYAGGNSVNVTMTNQLPAVVAEIGATLAKYQYGRFDGMTDSYEYTNSREDIPQTRFLFISNEFTEEKKQAAYEFLRRRFGGYESFPEQYKDLTFQRRADLDSNVTDDVYRVLSEVYPYQGELSFYQS
jgi:hypothetical protein